MLDLKWIRENPDDFDAAMARRGLPPQSGTVLALDEAHRSMITEMQELQARRNEASKAIGAAKSKGEDADALIEEVAGIKARIQQLEDEEREKGEAIAALLAGLPNPPASDVPDGEDEDANVELRKVGDKPDLGFEPKQHFELGEALGLMDFETAAKLSGARFVVLKGALARLERALGTFMLDLHTGENGYTEVVPPLLVRDDAMFGTGQLPKFSEDLFRTRKIDEAKFAAVLSAQIKIFAADGANQLNKHNKHNTKFDGNIQHWTPEEIEIANPQWVEEQTESLLQEIREGGNRNWFENLWLIPTAEVPLTNLARENIADEDDLPHRYTALTPCFRSEAGAAGKDTRGMLRQHQFSKVEMVSVTTPEQSEAEHERMTACAEEVLKRLGLHYRVVVLSTGDMGFGAKKTYDIEVWLPGQDAYREISSCSNCGDFQARRMKARLRRKGQKGTEFVHTLNGSGLAVGRTLIAVLENYQQADGSIAVPEVLRPLMGGLERISA